MYMMKTLITRLELYDLIWSTPLNKISVEYNLSIQQIKHSCNQNNIPLPGVGYWSKLKYGKQPLITPLDTSIPLDHIINLQDYTSNKSTQKSEISKKLKVAKQNNSLDILVQDYKQKRNIENRDKKQPTILIHTSDQLKKRAINFMNIFIKLMRKRGFDFIEEYGVIVLEFKGITMSFSIREHRNRIPTTEGPYYYDSIYKHSGKLIFSAGPSYDKKEWLDSTTIKLEDKLVNIATFIESKAQEKYQRKIDSEKNRIIREIEELKLKEIEKLKKLEKDKFDTLINQAKDYETCVQIKFYIQAIEKKAILDNNLTPELINWLNWAKSKVEDIDPIKNFNFLKKYF